MPAHIDIPSVYDEVRRAYGDMGYPVSGDRLVVSEQPTYVDGRPVPKDVLAPNSSGGNTQHDGTVRINPRYRAVMRHWGVKGSGRDFLRTIIGHELGHHVDRTVLRTRARSAERRRLLGEIARSGFHTVYTDSYGPDTDRRKLDNELLAEYLAKQVSGRLGKRAESKPISFPAEEINGLRGKDVLWTTRVSDDLKRYGRGDVVEAPWGRKYSVDDAVVVDGLEKHPFLSELTDSQRKLLGRYRRMKLLRLSALPAELRDGPYEDVKSVYDALSDVEKNFVTPGRTVYKDVPRFLSGRTVAYDGGEPVGFADIYGYNRSGSLRASPSICLAVSGSARGRGLAGSMARDAMRKVLDRAREMRRESGAAADRVRRFVWMVLDGNEASARAALRSGFKERKSHEAGARKFTMTRRDAERMFDESAGSHPRRDNAEADKDAARA